jgi:parallel beta-helix repeat protein
VVKINKKIITVFALIFSVLILSGIVFAFQKNGHLESADKDLLEEFGSDRIRSAQVNKNDEIEDLKSYSAQAVFVGDIDNNDNDDNIENQKQSIAQKMDFIAKIGKELFGIEKKNFFRPLNKIVELKNFKAPKIINVPEDYSEIQTAIDSANFGDTIKVASGEYTENIIMKEGISLIGSNEMVFEEEDKKQDEENKNIFEEESAQEIINETIINGEGLGNVVSFKNGITNKTKLSGFTIKNSGENLSGIFIENSSPWIHDNVLIENEYNIYIKGKSSPIIQKNIIRFANKGIQVYNFEKQEGQEKPIIIDNLITDNKIGIDLYQSSALIGHNTISYNNHYKTYLGATFGIYIKGSSAEISNNIITDSGICDLCSGINVDEESKDIIISYNDIWNNKNNFVCFGECAMEDNNISEDPMFVDYINGDYKLSEVSGLIGMCEDESDAGVRW